ncbi:protein tyrosine phosphatase [Pantoea phytobeneficialis]|uniref:protein-tyrosine-phosphatase n=1 Tax=Pantoea phytobeneficialis TaxID=2052056 RepID=A0AAP9HA11_9GAMM|nr:protein tyrosine phosphatase [Pantoea phytobeneficialis]MDO6407408.1 protein tyrosine phosphatase [Pantoea phytobeneficialis]QGR09560.1 protein tyrosine phosphatase [Pantoea phytobeneficialis]
MFDSILVICTGNICRSPIAERLLRRAMPHKKIDSAGVGALVGHPADPAAERVAIKHGVTLKGHSGTKFESAMGRNYELLLVMEKEHLEQISRRAPELRGKTMLLGHWINDKEIPDPYHKSDEAFESVYQLIDQACQHWASKLGS